VDAGALALPAVFLMRAMVNLTPRGLRGFYGAFAGNAVRIEGMLISFLLFLWLGAAARGSEAQAVTRAFEAHYRDVHTMEAEFLERYGEGKKSVRAESGRVYFSKPNRMRWEYESPETKLFLVDGKNAWLYVPAERTASRAKVKESTDWRTPLALLAGEAKLERLCGTIELVEGASAEAPGNGSSARGNHVLRCLPRESKSGEASFREVLFEVDGQSRLARVLIRDAGDTETEFRFGNWKENIPLPEDKFHFQAPAGVAIVDEAALAGAAR
jgi:outer membrane lipoprotein carrier protein